MLHTSDGCFDYWKDYESDICQGRIGYFRSANDKLEELRQRSPDEIWVVKAPRGCKGQLQLLGRLVWSDSPTTKVMAAPGESLIHYRPDDPRSVWFDEGVAQVCETLGVSWESLSINALNGTLTEGGGLNGNLDALG